jgi:hypothetical protein
MTVTSITGRRGEQRGWKCPGCGRTYCVCRRRRCGLVARWVGGRPGTGLCPACGEDLDGNQCPSCGHVVTAQRRAQIATVVDTPAGRRLVVAERTRGGGWVPTRVVRDGVDEAAGMVRRQNGRNLLTGGGLL